MHRASHDLHLLCALIIAAAVGGEHARAQAAPELAAAVGVGAGVAASTLRVPTATGVRRLATDIYPALDLRVAVAATLTRTLLFDTWALYQTSLGLRVAPPPLEGGSEAPRAALRAHSLRIATGPGLWLVRVPFRLIGYAFLGWSFRGMRSVAELSVPAFTLQGPLLRPELRASFGSAGHELIVAPELGLSFASGALRNAGAAAQPGIGLGGEIAVDFRVHGALHLLLSYRGSQQSFRTAYARHLLEVDHCLTLRVELRH